MALLFKAPSAESPRGDSQGPAEPSRALALPPSPPRPPPSLPVGTCGQARLGPARLNNGAYQGLAHRPAGALRGGGTHPSRLQEIPLAPNAVLDVDQLLEVFLRAGAGRGRGGQGPHLLCKERAALLPLWRRKHSPGGTCSQSHFLSLVGPGTEPGSAGCHPCGFPAIQLVPAGLGVTAPSVCTPWRWSLGLTMPSNARLSGGHCSYSSLCPP